MNDFTRIIWSSEKARSIWEPRIHRAATEWLEVEIRSVKEGLRRNALVFGRVEDLPSVQIGNSNRFAVGHDCVELARALETHDNSTVGRLLGFPDCCRAFFDRTWGAGALDTTFQMAVGGTSGPVQCNILGRWLGIRLVTHLPCSFDCEPTRKLGEAFGALLSPEAAATVQEVLSWPVEWSALHGIAEIKFPVLKISTRTTYTDDKIVVQREGTRYPEEGASGIVFPYQKQRVSTTVHFHRPAHRDNGFSSLQAQEESHAMVLATLAASPPRGLVLDLGCGNGRLLERVREQFQVPAMGVERDRLRAGSTLGIIVVEMKELPGLTFPAVDTLLVSERRFEELPWLYNWCKEKARQVLVYSYDAPVFAKVEVIR